MPHWLEEAEKHNIPESDSSRKVRITKKYQSIQENYAQFKQPYDAFIDNLHQLIIRVNNLPAPKRVPFGKMEGREKESKLDNRLNIFSSSQRIKKSGLFGFLPFTKTEHFKHIRVIYMNISDKPGMIDVEIKEYILQRELLRSDKSATKEKTGRQSKLHVIYQLPVEEANEQLGLEIIDWLAFSKEIADCLFFSMIPENQKHYI